MWSCCVTECILCGKTQGSHALCKKKKKAPIYFVVTSKKAHINTLDMSQLESFDEVL